jgi:hypothetical protein
MTHYREPDRTNVVVFLLFLVALALVALTTGCAGQWVYEEDHTWRMLPSQGMRYTEPHLGTICYENARGFLSCVREQCHP